MRHVTWALCALTAFVVSFAVIYMSLRTSAPEIRVVGGGFFLPAVLLLLWRDVAPSILPKRVAEPRSPAGHRLRSGAHFGIAGPSSARLRVE